MINIKEIERTNRINRETYPIFAGGPVAALAIGVVLAAALYGGDIRTGNQERGVFFQDSSSNSRMIIDRAIYRARIKNGCGPSSIYSGPKGFNRLERPLTDCRTRYERV